MRIPPKDMRLGAMLRVRWRHRRNAPRRGMLLLVTPGMIAILVAIGVFAYPARREGSKRFWPPRPIGENRFPDRRDVCYQADGEHNRSTLARSVGDAGRTNLPPNQRLPSWLPAPRASCPGTQRIVWDSIATQFGNSKWAFECLEARLAAQPTEESAGPKGKAVFKPCCDCSCL